MTSYMGRRVKRLREAREWSQPDLAKRAKVSQAYIAELEHGTKRNPSVRVAVRLAKALGVPVTALLK
jgi:XRE family aerobic/anaerobic benzoate catabolism transcriptional regulator